MKDSHAEFIPLSPSGQGCPINTPTSERTADLYQYLSTSYLTSIRTTTGYIATFDSSLRPGTWSLTTERSIRSRGKAHWSRITDVFVFVRQKAAYGYRLLLRTMHVQGEEGAILTPPYQFAYYGDDVNSPLPHLPDRLSNDLDYRGYYNQAGNGDQDLVSVMHDEWNRHYVFLRGSRSPNEQAMLTGALQSITYPTGGRVAFAYEGHRYSRIVEPSSPNNYLPISSTFEQRQVNTTAIGEVTPETQFTLQQQTEIDITMTFNPANMDGVNPGDGMTGSVSLFQLSPSNSAVSSWDFTYNACNPDCPVPYTTSTQTVSVTLDAGTYELRAFAEERDPVGPSHYVTAMGAQVAYVEEIPATDRLAGGLRIKKITQHPETDSPPVVQRFVYERSDGTSSGVLLGEPRSYYRRYVSPTCVELYNATQAQSMLGVGKELGYSRVVVYYADDLADGSPDTSAGYTEHTFHAADAGDGAYRDDPLFDVPVDTRFSRSLWPFARLTSLAYKRGVPHSTTHYDATGKKVSATVYTYFDSYIDDFIEHDEHADLRQTKRIPALAFRRDSRGMSSILYYMKRYHVLSAWQYQESDASYQYDQSGHRFLLSRKVYEYDNPDHMLPTRVNETNTDSTKRISSYIYAHEEYPGMKRLNMLSQSYSSLVEDEPGNDRSKSWTTWKNDDPTGPTAYWKPDAQYVWDPGNPNDVEAPSRHDSNSLKVTRTISYDTYLPASNRVVTSSDARGTTSSTRWGYNDALPRTVAQHAPPEKVFAETFDTSMPITPWQPLVTESGRWNVYNSDHNDTRWRTTNGRLELSHAYAPNEQDRIEYVHNANWTGKTVFEFDLTVDESSHWDFLLLLTSSGDVPSTWMSIRNRDLYYYVYSGGGCSAGWKPITADLSPGETYHLKLVLDIPARRVDYYVDGEKKVDQGCFAKSSAGAIRKIKFQNYGYAWDSGTWYIDNVRLYNADAAVTTAAYNPDTRLLSSITDPQGVTSYFDYDPMQRLVEVRDQKHQPVVNHKYRYSLSQSPSYNPSDPNWTESTSLQYENLIHDWSMETTYGNSGATDWEIHLGGTPGPWGIDKDVAKIGARSLKASISASSQRTLWRSSYNIYIDDDKLYQMAIWAKTSGGYSGGAYYRLFFKDANGKALYHPQARIDIPSGDRDWTLHTLTFKPPAGAVRIYAQYLDFIGTSRRRGTVWWDGAQLHKTPRVALAYFDGLGRSLQEHTPTEDGSVITATTYNAQGQALKTWSPFMTSSTGTFEPDILSSSLSYFNQVSLQHNGCPYTETVFSKDPLLRPLQMHAAGWCLGSLIRKETEYDVRKASTGITHWIHTHHRDEDDKVAEQFHDGFGNLVESSVGVTAPLTTTYSYDILGRMLRATSPAGRSIYYAYDQVSRRVSMTTPDADGNGMSGAADEDEHSSGDFRYKYDRSGNLRFLRDPNHRAQGGFVYYKYDALSRLIEEGIYTGTTPWELANTDDAMWPYFNAQKRIEYTYEGTALSQVDMWDDQGHHDYYAYVHNEQGQVTSLTTTLSGLGSKRVSYEYNQLGNPSRVIYQRGVPGEAFYTWYDYNARGLLTTVRTSTIDNKSQSERQVAYTYWPNGNLKDMLLGPDPAGTPQAVQALDYDYTMRGFLQGINDIQTLADSRSLGGDVFAQRIGYDNTAGGIGAVTSPDAAYNGTISWTTWRTKENTFTAPLVGYAYNYDEYHRLVTADFAYHNGYWSNSSTRYDVGVGQPIAYDPNGNITSLLRRNELGSGSSTTYSYFPGSNRLANTSGSEPHTFNYDSNGNITSGGGIMNGDYNYRNMITSMGTGSPTTYRYNKDGLRIFTSSGDGQFFIRGIDGAVLAVYDGARNLLYHNVIAGGRVAGKVLP